MLSRISFGSAIVFVVPIVLMLAAIVLLRTPKPVLVDRSTMSQPSARATSDATAQVIAGPAEARAVATVLPTPPPRPTGPQAPEFDGGGAWINSAPLKLADLTGQGKVVLVDFWTYGCYNCQNTLPYVKQWWAKYQDRGLVIVGVHTPEFQSEHELANVQQAVQQAEIGWPVVQDNDYTIWRAYANHYWPHFYLIDERGQIIYDHIGEGAYAETDRQIAAALVAAKGQ